MNWDPDDKLILSVVAVIAGAILAVSMVWAGLAAQREVNRMQERSSRYQTCMQRAQTPRDCEHVLGRYKQDEE